MGENFDQEVNTRVLSGQHFDDYVDELTGHRKQFHSTVKANSPVFSSSRRSDIDKSVEQLPDPSVTEEVFRTLEGMPKGDYKVMDEAVGVFTRMERENAEAADTIVTGPTNVHH
jgi:hypothetical protein